MSFTNPFTAKLNPDTLNPINPEIIMDQYNPQTQTVIDAQVSGTNPATGEIHLTNGHSIIETEKLEVLRRNLAYAQNQYSEYVARIVKVQHGFRNFLIELWELGLDEEALNEFLKGQGLPSKEKTFAFAATVTIQVTNIKGKGEDADTAWDNVDEDAIREAFEDGNYDSWSIDKPYNSDDSDEVDDDDDVPDFSEASIFDLI